VVAHARPEFAIVLALLGILLAIGIPTLQRGQVVVGGLCLLAAAFVSAWAIVAIVRSRSASAR